MQGYIYIYMCILVHTLVPRWVGDKNNPLSTWGNGSQTEKGRLLAQGCCLQVKRFKYVRVSFMRWRVAWKTDRLLQCLQRCRCDAIPVCPDGEKAEHEGKAVHLPADLFSYPHLWPQRVGSDPKNYGYKKAMSFLWRVSGLILREKVRNVVIHEGFKIESCSSSTLKAAGWCACVHGAVLGMSDCEGILGYI